MWTSDPLIVAPPSPGRKGAMLDSDFWGDLGERFRKLDPHNCLRLEWTYTPSTKACDFQLIPAGDSCSSVDAQFKVLGTKAGRALRPLTPLRPLTAWFGELRGSGVNDRPSVVYLTPVDAPAFERWRGCILHICEASANLCSHFERVALDVEHATEILQEYPELREYPISKLVPSTAPLRTDMQSDFDSPTRLKVERETLRDSYLSAFPEKIYILDVCWAAKQRYREWTRWIGGHLKDKSKPARAML